MRIRIKLYFLIRIRIQIFPTDPDLDPDGTNFMPSTVILPKNLQKSMMAHMNLKIIFKPN
jgi:hypothetical protein